MLPVSPQCKKSNFGGTHSKTCIPQSHCREIQNYANSTQRVASMYMNKSELKNPQFLLMLDDANGSFSRQRIPLFRTSWIWTHLPSVCQTDLSEFL